MLKTNNQCIILSAFINIKPSLENHLTVDQNKITRRKIDLLQPLLQWLDSLEIENRKSALLLARLIPAQCPFERDVILFGRKNSSYSPNVQAKPSIRPTCRFTFSRFVLFSRSVW